jgi:trehalose 6-phosphate synthase
MDSNRLVVVSNRLPIVVTHDPVTDRRIVTQGQGGLVTALAPVLRNRGGIWMGWLGQSIDGDLPEILSAGARESGYELDSIDLTENEVSKYYDGFSNEVLWPLFHDLVTRCNFDPSYWPVYQRVNQKFARRIADITPPDSYIWVQDYHLMLVARELRELGVTHKVGFFLHVPFPSLDVFLKLPWRFAILRGLMDYDLVGFQTMRDKRNFIQCVRALIPGVRTKGNGMISEIITPDRDFRVGAFPISIDFSEFERQAQSQESAEKAWIIHANFPEQQLLLGVDRLDYSKGIPNRIKAIENVLERYPELIRKISFLQIVVPSRTDVPEYKELKEEIEGLVGRVNGRFSVDGWVPIHYVFRSLDRTELVAHYRTCEVAFVTPLKDGMNLVAKEYCAANIEQNGVLILSEFAGAAAQLHRHALIVNPWDIEGMAEAIHQAVTMQQSERNLHMRALRNSIRNQNVFRWVNTFLKAAISKDLGSFPNVDFDLHYANEQESIERHRDNTEI